MVHATGAEDGLQDGLALAPRGGQADDPVRLLRVEELVPECHRLKYSL